MLTDDDKQEIHNQTGAGHALICLVESFINDKLLTDVELPEPDVPEGDWFVRDVYIKEYAQAYAAAAAAQARMKALEEAKQEAVKRHAAGEAAGILISKAIESLKGKQ